MIDRLGKETVLGRHLVERRHHQLLVDVADAVRLERAAYVTDCDIEISEGSNCAHAHNATLRGLRADIFELLEARRILDVVEQREGVAPFGPTLDRLCTRRLGEWKPLKRWGDGGNKSGMKQGSAAQAHWGLQEVGWGRHVFSRT